MMKVKTLLLVVISILLLSNFILAEAPPSVIGKGDYDKLQGGIDQYNPVDHSGQVNLNGYKPFVTKAEERIATINSWLNENAMWLSIVFGMVPTISILFFANLYIIFFLIVFLVLNSKYNIGMIPRLEKKISSSSSITYSKIVGIAILMLLMVLKATVIVGKIISDFILFVWNKVIPTSIILAIVVIVVLIVLLFLCPTAVAAIFEFFAKMIVQDPEKRAMMDVASDRRALHQIVKEATKD